MNAKDDSTPPTTIPDRSPDEARLRLLHALAGGAGAVAATALLREGWKSPVVKSIVLPAHAQATGEIINGLFQTETIIEVADSGGSVLDLVVPRALAGKTVALTIVGCVAIENSQATGCVYINNVILNVDGVPVPGSQSGSNSEFDVTIEFVSVTGVAPGRTLHTLVSRSGPGNDFEDEPVSFTEFPGPCSGPPCPD